ncbi:hypothetical protein CELL_01690 [Cellulomonas sp. T2.31MG-18]
MMLPINKLLLDWRNPRLRPDEQGAVDLDNPDSDASQAKLAEVMASRYNPLPIAESIARHQYFLSEPMIAVQHGDKFRVIEGNRRLTALKILKDPQLRAAVSEKKRGWASLPSGDYSGTFPVLVVRDEETIAPLLGYRHISGIEPWAAFAQARYIASLVDDERKPLEEVADLVGKGSTAVRSMYRDYDLLRQAEERFQIDTARAKARFGILNNAMSRQGIREFIGAPAPRNVDPSKWPIPDSYGARLREVLSYIFGEAAESDDRIITDSRQLGDLSKVLARPDGRGLEVLRHTRDLELALAAIDEPAEQLHAAVTTALKALRGAPSPNGWTIGPATLEGIQQITSLLRRYTSGAERP